MDWKVIPAEQRVTEMPSAESTADKLIRALQDGDVALVLARERLDLLIVLVEAGWKSQDQFDLLQELKNLRDTTR